MKTIINVGIIGFSLHERDKFKYIFSAGLDHDRKYTLTDLTERGAVDILVVKTATKSALQKQASYQQKHGSLPVVTAGKVPLKGFKYHIQGVLIVSRVLKALDLVDLNLECETQKSLLKTNESLVEMDIDVGSQYDILVVNKKEEIRNLLKDELAKSDIPLNIDFALDDVFAIQKIKEKHYDFLFVDEDIANFDVIEKSIRRHTEDDVRSSVVMPTTKAKTVEYSQVVLKFLKLFSDFDNMIVDEDEEENETKQESKVYDVLIVDDSRLMHDALDFELDKSELKLNRDYAFTGEEALKKLEDKCYDITFLDVMMPGIDGFETCTRIRKLKGMGKAPIIMLTSKASPLDEVKGIMAGCTTYLVKPIKPEEFQKMLLRINRWL